MRTRLLLGVFGILLLVAGVLVLGQAMAHPLNSANILGPILIGVGFYTTLRAAGGSHG